MTLEDLKKRRQNDMEKQAIACLLRRRTAVTHEWVVEHLQMGSRYSVRNAVKAIDESMHGKKGDRLWKGLLAFHNSLH